MSEREFNLLCEPWIRVIRPDCATETVSLVEALLRAHEFGGLNGELPTQDAAVLRLLLAALHTIFSRVDEKGQPAPLDTVDAALNRWGALWKAGSFPEEPIRDYFERWKDRFWLFDPERPFGQTPAAAIGTEYSAAKLNGEMSESNNKTRLFPLYAGQAKNELDYAQAARWLLYVNAYDDTSAKPKSKSKNTKLPSPGAGWLGKLGLITATGDNLFETLMLNFTLLRDDGTLWGENKPAWELDAPRSGERIEIPMPENQAELLTLSSRRLLLQRNGAGKVTGYTLLGGDFFSKQNAFAEQMTVWSRASEKTLKTPEIQPRRHDAAKQIWREFPAIFCREEAVRVPGIVSWITRLKSLSLLDKKRMICFKTASVQFGDKDFFVTDVFSDSLTFHTGLLVGLGRVWQTHITDEIGRCGRLAGEIGRLAENLSKAAGIKPSNGKKNTKIEKIAFAAREQLYYRLDEPFRGWLCELEPDQNREKVHELRRQWQKTAQGIARGLGKELVDQAGETAFAGREVSEKIKGKEVTRRYSAPEAYNWFLHNIKVIYK